MCVCPRLRLLHEMKSEWPIKQGISTCFSVSLYGICAIDILDGFGFTNEAHSELFITKKDQGNAVNICCLFHSKSRLASC